MLGSPDSVTPAPVSVPSLPCTPGLTAYLLPGATHATAGRLHYSVSVNVHNYVDTIITEFVLDHFAILSEHSVT